MLTGGETVLHTENIKKKIHIKMCLLGEQEVRKKKFTLKLPPQCLLVATLHTKNVNQKN